MHVQRGVSSLLGEAIYICRHWQLVGDLDESYTAFASMFEHVASNCLTIVGCETGFSQMNMIKDKLRNALSQGICLRFDASATTR